MVFLFFLLSSSTVPACVQLENETAFPHFTYLILDTVLHLEIFMRRGSMESEGEVQVENKIGRHAAKPDDALFRSFQRHSVLFLLRPARSA
jgi:hypothetical protein